MSAAIQDKHDTVLRGLVEQYSSRGYAIELSVVLSMRDGTRVQADLVARKGDETVVVEVALMASSRQAEPSLARLAEVAQERGWRFVVVIADARDLEEIEVPSADEVRAKLVEARALDPHSSAAPLLAWAVLESAARHALVRFGNRAVRATAPRALVQQLAALGLIDLAEERALTTYAAIRSRVAHGRWSANDNVFDVDRVLAIAERLLEPVPAANSA